MTKANYNPIVIGTSAVKLNINDGGLYDAVINARQELSKREETSGATIIPFQQNIAIIQQIYLALTKELTIPVAGVDISFIDDEWDFTKKYHPGKGVANYRFSFSVFDNAPLILTDYMKTVLKLYAIYIITDFGIDCGTNSSKFSETKRFLKYLDENHIYTLEAVTVQDIQDYYNSKNINYSTMVKKRRHIQNFLVFYSFLTGHDIYTREIDDWFKDIDTSMIKSIIADNKTPCPPSDFYKKYSDYNFGIVFDESLPKFERGLSGLLYIGTQTGLRGSELTILNQDCIEVFLLNAEKGLQRLSVDEIDSLTFDEKNSDDKVIGILHYRATKNGGRRGNVYTKGESNASQKVIQVILKLRKLFADERKAYDTDALVPNEDSSYRRGNAEYRPYIDEVKLLGYSRRVCIRNAKNFDVIDTPDANLFKGQVVYYSNDYKEIKKKSKYTVKDMLAGGVSLGQMVSYITLAQFRVYVASDYHARGVDDRTISYLLNHHSKEMWGYYVRDNHPIQEDIDFSKEIVSEIVQDHTKILGPKGDAYEKRIEDIILNHKLNVQTDLDAVIDVVCGEMPIRAKFGGFCMKTNPDRDCWYDGVTNEFMCAYGCCPNHCHMYFMAPITLQKARDIMKAIEYNMACEYVNAAEKEAYKLKACLDNELSLELQEVQRELEKHGRDWIISKHPETESVIDHIDSIFEDIEEWKTQIKQLISST